jgi:hypothetical protein
MNARVITVHRIPSWTITYRHKPCDTVYDQTIALDRFADPTATEMTMTLRERVCLPDRADPDTVGVACYICGRTTPTDTPTSL